MHLEAHVLDVHCTRPPGGRKAFLAYSAPPHDLVADPRLTPTDVRIAAALMFWARGKDHCWPSDRTIGARVGRSPGTVQRSLRRLEAAGWIRREKTAANRTGRLIVLAWRRAGARPLPPMAREAPAAPARDELTVALKGEAPKEPREASVERPRPEIPAPAPDATPVRSAADLALAWLASGDPILMAEASRRLAPPPPRLEPPTSTGDLLSRIRESPAHVAAAAELLSRELDDRKSWSGFHAACRRAWEGSIPTEALVTAHREATNGKARSPGALFMAVLKREARAVS
jgi:DNA-binding Lrp family transcriptional regulator